MQKQFFAYKNFLKSLNYLRAGKSTFAFVKMAKCSAFLAPVNYLFTSRALEFHACLYR